jgi:hypothetical protein
MAAGIKKIHGFLPEEQDIRPFFNRTEIKEVVRVEMNTTRFGLQDNAIDMIEFLPSFASGPGDPSINPLGITFTLYQSPHPKAASLVLLECSGIKRVSGSGTFYDVTLNYGNFIPGEITTVESSNSPNPGSPIVSPLQQPPVWSSSSNIVQKQTMTRPNGKFIVHENGLAITSPISYEEAHTVHTWSFNVNYDSTNYYSDIASYVGFVGRRNDTLFGVRASYWKFTAASSQEMRESYGTGKSRVRFHYLKCQVSFEYNPSDWLDDAKLYSRSTYQRVNGKLIPIKINDLGDRAQEPWPLQTKEPDGDCFGAPYNVNPPNIDLYAVLDTGYPQTANIGTVPITYGLNIP